MSSLTCRLRLFSCGHGRCDILSYWVRLDLPLQLPAPSAGTITRELPYTHFTILLDPVRRLAIATGVNINGDQLIDVDRGDDWHLDPRIPNNEQTGEAVYAKNDLDRGHLVRRRDPVWGDAATAQQANADTFTYTNAAPQAGAFNQSKELWLGLEDHVLTYAHTNKNRISVFTAPVLFEEDPVYRGVRVLQLFWKVAAWTTTVDCHCSSSRWVRLGSKAAAGRS
ncbi:MULTISPECIES: DNA/RNA non-specific endonuclease [Cryobacterium]|uniref:DNA/RNA non-specific endonuclease n=1 Tax=Cryobacterium TaxID=69578 RepID=UPI00311AACB3